MNLKRFTAKTSREALALVRQSLGEDAVVLSTRPGADGVEVLAMAPDGLQQAEAAAAQTSLVRATQTPTAVEDDVQTLGMSTLTFQDYVRERMLKRRQAELDDAGAPTAAVAATAAAASAARTTSPARSASTTSTAASQPARALPSAPDRRPATSAPALPMAATARRDLPVLRDEIRHAGIELGQAGISPAQRGHSELLGELRSMKDMIERRFGMLAFMEKLQRHPRQAELAQKLLDTGLSPALIRKVVQGVPDDVGDELAWASAVLERNVLTDENEPALEETGGVYALIGPTGVGKTTTTAKLAAAFATRYGAANLGLITLDAYRVAAHEQLRTYGRILGVPVHTAHDRASLEDLLGLLAAKKMVLIDTAGMSQRDTRTRELLDMLSHASIQKLLVVNAAAQGETVEDVMVAYGAPACRGVILSKLDEAVKLGPALDAMIRHKSKVMGVANGQRVPEDWHRLSAQALVQRVLRGGGSSSWRLDAGEVNLVFAGRHGVQPAASHA